MACKHRSRLEHHDRARWGVMAARGSAALSVARYVIWWHEPDVADGNSCVARKDSKRAFCRSATWAPARGRVPERNSPSQREPQRYRHGQPIGSRGLLRTSRTDAVLRRYPSGPVSAPSQDSFARSLTPGPPPLASMNSTPAASRARLIARLLGAVIDVSPAASSARRIVVAPTDDAFARSAALQRMRARAARIWALVRGGGMLTKVSTRNNLFHKE
jgi:hypothetical protein